MGGTTADKRDMSASDNFEYDAEGNMTKDYSKDLTIAYDWRGMLDNVTHYTGLGTEVRETHRFLDIGGVVQGWEY
ncbi:MAG: hypothetical protein MJY82_06755 [Fibrobacter sp.]|nr:hypothetical protein [Fibrobacter sp.]